MKHVTEQFEFPVENSIIIKASNELKPRFVVNGPNSFTFTTTKLRELATWLIETASIIEADGDFIK